MVYGVIRKRIEHWPAFNYVQPSPPHVREKRSPPELPTQQPSSASTGRRKKTIIIYSSGSRSNGNEGTDTEDLIMFSPWDASGSII